MKKLMVLMLVLGLSSVASATIVSLMDPGVTVDETGTRVYIAVDATGLLGFCATVTVTGDVTITGGTLKAEAGDHGVQATDYTTIVITDGGWQSDLSFDTLISGGGSIAELGLAHFGSTIYGATTDPVVLLPVAPGSLGMMVSINTPIAYLDIFATGSGGATLTMVGGSVFGSESRDGEGPIAGYGDALVLSTIPEPMTIALLGLGGLLLRRKKA